MTSGAIRRVARLARAYAAMNAREDVTLADTQEAARALNRQALDRLTTPIETYGDWGSLAVSEEVLEGLRHLEMRCRSREGLYAAVSETLRAQMNAGVRALFSGPSGTGKTLAAKILASVLQMDLYRLDLSTAVNKYIGETEKNLNRIFARVEELDVILLIDEGDALLTQRTGVHTSNDRYANLETNYLLQRLESFEGIVIVTTNASERIDSAFQRRMDVVVDFRAPEAAERWAIWGLHLPPNHAVDPAALREITARCALSGGQIRNAALHATLLALDEESIITTSHLYKAIWREYRKAGDICPLRPVALNGHRAKEA
jgi:SpoVK/Ycf46/Vps4 family AAA+-type ATPase